MAWFRNLSYMLIIGISLQLKCSLVFGVSSGGVTVLNGQIFNWTHSTKLPSGMEVSWMDSDPDYITIEMKGPTKGYLAIGFSPSGGMAGGDMFVGWVDKIGKAHLLDMFGTHNGQPILDRTQNLKLIGGKEDVDETLIIFRRPWNTCDDQDFVIGDDTMRLIWAISETDPVYQDRVGYLPLYHGQSVAKRGVKSIFMKVQPNHKKFPDQEEVYPPNVRHVDLTVQNVIVPRLETYYHCTITKFPRLSSKHHIIANRPLIAPESIPHIHHINIYKCHIPEILGISPETAFEKYVGQYGSNCYTEDSPREWTEYCFEFRVAIGVGSEGDILPDHLGDVIGDTDGPTYYRMEVHYENPQGKNLTVSSGIRLFYTSELRPYETAVLFAGHRRTPFLTIPPGQREYTAYSFCGSECTRKGLPEEGIKIISVLLHAHLTGRNITLRHIRNGKELPIIAQDNHVDFNYQHYRKLKEEVLVLPGDELITECTFNTELNDTFIYGGLSTRREMCESFAIYYPKTALIDCRSQPEFYSYFNAIGVGNAAGILLDKLRLPFNSRKLPENMQNSSLADDSMVVENGRVDQIAHDIFREIYITEPKHIKGNNVHDYMTSLPWGDKDFVKSVEHERKNGLHYMHCSAQAGRKIHTSRDAFPFPIYEPRIVEQKECLLTSSSSAVGLKSYKVPTFLMLILAITFFIGKSSDNFL